MQDLKEEQLVGLAYLEADGVWQGQRKDVDVFAVLADEWPLEGST